MTSAKGREPWLTVASFVAIIGLSYWAFADDDLEDVSQYALESALDGDVDDVAELNKEYIDWRGRFSMWCDDVGDFTAILFGGSEVNYAVVSQVEYIVQTLEQSAEHHKGWDEVEVVAFGAKEVPHPKRTFVEWVSSLFAPKVQVVDEKGSVMARVTYDDGSVEFYEQFLTHVDSSEYTVDGWLVDGWSLKGDFKATEIAAISEFEQETIERYHKRYHD